MKARFAFRLALVVLGAAALSWPYPPRRPKPRACLVNRSMSKSRQTSTRVQFKWMRTQYRLKPGRARPSR